MAEQAPPPDPRSPLPPGPKGRPGWRIEPAPDGRGKPPEKPPMLPFSFRRFLAILLALFALNYVLAAVFAPEEKRIRVPYSPLFLEQVRAGNVKSISSEGES